MTSRTIAIGLASGMVLLAGIFLIRRELRGTDRSPTLTRQPSMAAPYTWETRSECAAILYTKSSQGAPVCIDFGYSGRMRRVFADWEVDTDPNSFISDPLTASSQYTLDYKPTALASMGSWRLLVAGMRGESPLLEEWTFGPASHVEQVVTVGPRLGVKPASGSIPTSHGYIATIWPSSHDPQKVLCLSRKQGILFYLNTHTGRIVDAASSTTRINGIQAEPLLSRRWKGSWGPLEHDTLGAVYALSDLGSHPADPSEKDEISELVLVDQGNNGSIDMVLPMSPFAVDQAGLNDMNRLKVLQD